MKLNAGIIFDNLKDDISVEMYGPRNEELHLERPKFYVGNEKNFYANQLYLAMADRLPARPELQKDTVIIGIGDSLQLSSYRGKCCLLHVLEKTDPFTIANLVQGIFDTYDSWNEDLYEILSSTASVKDMLERSTRIFENPLFVIDSDFRIIANTGYFEPVQKIMIEQPDADMLGLPTLAQFLEHGEPSMHIKDPLLINMLDTSTLNTNLFSHDEYIGCLSVDYRERRHRPSDISLAKHLAGMTVQALQKLSAASSNERSTLKAALQDIVGGMPTTSEQHRALESAHAKSQYVCMKMELGSRLDKLPIGFICNEIENTFPHSIAFEYDASAVGFIDIKSMSSADKPYRDALEDMVSEFIQSMDIYIGVSDRFEDLFGARLFYRQSTAALDMGSLINPTKRYFVFQDFALTEMVVNATGELPIEMYYSSGIRRLVEHDAKSWLSYVDTLRVYLDNNMSIAKTAAALFVHRSTLLERLARIERELDTDLKDPDERLRVQILLKSMQIHDHIRGEPEAP